MKPLSIALLLFYSAIARASSTPVITAINPASAPTAGASAFVVEGSNFGSDTSVLNLTIGSTACRISYAFNTVLLATPLPAGVGNGLDVVLKLTDSFSGSVSVGDFPQAFSYYAPLITSVVPQAIATSGQSTTTVFGEYFGISDSQPKVTISGGSTPSRVSWVSDTSIICTMPSGAGGTISVMLQVGGQYATSNNIFSYLSPTVASVNPVNFAAKGNTVASVTGSEFAVFDTTPRVSVGGTTGLSSVWRADTSIAIQVSPGVGSALNLVVTVVGQAGTKAASVSFLPPSATALNPDVFRTDGTTTFTLFGSNFGASYFVIGPRFACPETPRVTHLGHRCVRFHRVSVSGRLSLPVHVLASRQCHHLPSTAGSWRAGRGAGSHSCAERPALAVGKLSGPDHHRAHAAIAANVRECADYSAGKVLWLL